MFKQKAQNYSLQFITHLWINLHPQSLIKYMSLTILTFIAFKKYMWIWIQSSMKFFYYYVGTTIPTTTHKPTNMIKLECQAYINIDKKKVASNYRQIKCIHILKKYFHKTHW